eukprot:CAMPEP_0172847060 /NCGR_PEP_ID=MMETSP1075-20121228/39715_1 /TAXON_ID=2916 /ORGANISM="Ceratium fusus, Strain PA161109" /LENGTH=60 /DNA_ID=CAMNT_0013692007 /DNA_START=43 /DNA_END=222 /DNA_ORIENTATION=+
MFGSLRTSVQRSGYTSSKNMRKPLMHSSFSNALVRPPTKAMQVLRAGPRDSSAERVKMSA